MYTIIKSVKDVYNVLGYGLSESTYQKALALKLKQNFNQIELRTVISNNLYEP